MPTGTDPHPSSSLRAEGRFAKASRDIWHRGQQGWPASYPIVKAPNIPLLVVLVTYGCSTVTSGDLANVLSAISRAALAIWAYLELTDGGNLFRRALGLGFLIYLVIDLVTT